MAQLSSVYSANLMNWNVVIQEVVPVTHDTPYHRTFFVHKCERIIYPHGSIERS